MYAIETKNLTKSFNGFKAVDKLDLKVPAGSIYGFLGPNGAGKTTTIKMLTGLSQPTSGEISICGQEVKFGSLKSRKDIGFLPDVPNFYDWMTPVEFLKFSGELFSIDKKVLTEKTDNLLNLVGLQGVKKKIKGFSRGMKQRLGIAQALINDPKVVFLDEPTSALDPLGRKEVMDIIAKLSGKVTVFFSTHILSDIERVCDRVIILDKGKVQAEDNIDNLKRQYSRRGIVLEMEANSNAGKFFDDLKRLEWVVEITEVKNEEVTIYVNDMNAAQIGVPKALYENKIPLKKFITLEPTLEDIFLKVVNQK